MRSLPAVPLLLQPKILGLKNYWRRRSDERTMAIRDAVILAFGVGVMFGIYRGGVWMLKKMSVDQTFVYFHPSIPLGLIFVYLFVMLILSNAAAAIASLYLSNDLDLVLSAPLRPSRFFWGKFFDVLLGSSWITMIFILPAVFSFAKYFHAPIRYYLFSLAVLLPYFSIPTSLSIILVTFYSRFFPAGRTKELILVLAALALAGALFLFRMLFPSSESFSFRNIDDLLRLVNILSIPNTRWSPSYWASTCLAEFLAPTKSSFLPHLVLLYAVASGLLAGAFLVVKAFHFEAYSKAASSQRKLGFDSKRSQQHAKRLLFFCSPPVRAQVVKEFKMLSRDVSQLFQLLLLCGICLLYFYNFRIIHGIQSELPGESEQWWSVFVFMINSYIEAFLITAVGTRFVFQSVSLEGRSFWVMQSSPISLKIFLHTKFFCWLFPVAVVLGLVFGAGSYAVAAPWHLIGLKVLSTWVVCYGIVGLGIGLGAYYANFDWEHTTQLAASFGSLVYMLSCVALISLNMGIIGLLLVFEHYYEAGADIGFAEFLLSIASCALLFVYLNIFATRTALRLGLRELERRRG
jgi:ABC-2 type transport system permease protein